MRPELDNVLQCLSLNDYSVFSLINDILSHGSDGEDRRIKSLREGVERDSVKICARILNDNPASASVYTWAHGVAQSTTLSEVKERTREEDGVCFMTGHPLSLPNYEVVIPPSLSSGTAPIPIPIPTNSPEFFLNIGSARCTCSISVALPKSTDLELRSVVKYRQVVVIDPLPDDVFLEIFDLCLCGPIDHPIQRMRQWLRLVHVCQRWRRIIFASSHHLDLSLICTYGTPVRQNLVHWPLFFPLTIHYIGSNRSDRIPGDDDNILAALMHADRIHRVRIDATYSVLSEVATVMQEAFPALTDLDLAWDFEGPAADSPVLPDGFLGGSTRLQQLRLSGVSFPGLPTLLSSASNLVDLELHNMIPSACISPEAMVAGLAVLTGLRTFCIAFIEMSQFEWRSPSNPPNRAILPALTHFQYNGDDEYLEGLLALIDTPLVYNVKIEYFKERFMEEIQVPQLSRFIGRTENLKFAQFMRANVTCHSDLVNVDLDLPQGEFPQADITLTFSSIHTPRVVHALGQLATMFSNVDQLSVHGYGVWRGIMESTEWLLFLRLFPAVESLEVYGDLTRHIASALQDTTEDMVTELLPALYSMCFDPCECRKYKETVRSIEQFLSLRQLSGHPITVDNTDEFREN
jgi:hypothetical protein